MVLHSGTKFLGGHGDVMAGIVACDETWARRLRQVRILTGGNLHPTAAYTLHRGFQTLSVRIHAAQKSARTLAWRLSGHPSVRRVYYPALPSCDPLGLVGHQMTGPGTMVSIDLHGGFSSASKTMAGVRLVTPAVSLGSCDTLIQHPAGLTHRVVDPDARNESGIGPGLLRISVGLEDVDDIWRDLDLALAGVEGRLAWSAK